MKCFIIIIVFFVNLNVLSQAGTYTRGNLNAAGGTITKWTLTLNNDGTFLYHFLRDILGEQNPEENFYGKGTWKFENNLVFFYTDEKTELDETYTIDFTNSKARYITKPPRNKSIKVVKTALRFYESDLFYIKGLQLFKE